MTSLTTMTATSSLMQRQQAPTHEHGAGSQHRQAPHLAPSRVKPWAAIAAFVICVSLLGSIAVGLTTPTVASMAIADAESV